jgi:hypothetical protein
MADGDEVVRFTWSWLGACALLLVSTWVFYRWAGIGWEEGRKEIFAALCEAAVGVIFIGGGFSLHRWLVARSVTREQCAQALVRETRKVQTALGVMQTNKSVKPWSEQVLVLDALSTDMVELAGTMKRNGRKKAAAKVTDAVNIIALLSKEHSDKKGSLAALQSEFEKKYANRSADKETARPGYWDSILGNVPSLKGALDENQLLAPLNQANKMMGMNVGE